MIKKIVTILKRDGLIFTFKRSLALVLSHSPLAGRLSFSYYKNLRLVFAPSMLTYVLFANQRVRKTDIGIIERFVRTNDTVIDVGAHIGSMSVIAGSIVGEAGAVLAFEPVPKFFLILNQNVQKNNLDKIIKTYPYAVGAETKTVYINDEVPDDTTNYISTNGTEVKQIRLDDYTQNISTINFLKIDVEGYELEVLLGAHETLKKTSCLYIEFISDNLEQANVNPGQIIELLKNYFSLQYFKDGTLIPFSFELNKKYSTDLIGVPL